MAGKPRRTIHLIGAAHTAVRIGLGEALRDFNLSDIQFTILSTLNEHPGLSAADLARMFWVSAQSMNELTKGLERKGLIDRQTDDPARRVVRLVLSAHGQAVFAECERRVDALEAALFAGLGPDRQRRLRALLKAFAEDLDVERISGRRWPRARRKASDGLAPARKTRGAAAAE